MEQMRPEEVHEALYGILDNLLQFCEENSLTMFLLAGSALGAIRHGSIIPWDDDIDVGMLREDYEFFCKNYRESDRYHLYLRGKNHDYHFAYAKLSDTKTRLTEPKIKPIQDIGVSVDVFPLDYVTGNRLRLLATQFIKLAYGYGFLIDFSSPGMRAQPFLARLAKRALGVCARAAGEEGLYSIAQGFSARERPTKNLMNIWGSWRMKELYESSWFGAGAPMDFGGRICLVPADYDKYLRRMYGDYKKLPDPLPEPTYHGRAYWA